jgi:AraC-like DNA-binding protein
VLESALLEHFTGPQRPDAAIPAAAAAFECGARVRAVASHLGLGSKTLVRRFREHTGLTPKRFSRVRRVQRVVASLGAADDVDWSSVAAQHGYADQSHLVHDFRELTGLTPTAYRPRSAEAPNHVPVPAA